MIFDKLFNRFYNNPVGTYTIVLFGKSLQTDQSKHAVYFAVSTYITHTFSFRISRLKEKANCSTFQEAAQHFLLCSFWGNFMLQMLVIAGKT